MKTLKRIIAVLLIAATAFCMTSCLALDRMKERQMFFVEGEGDKISFNGKTYVKLPLAYYSTKYSRIPAYNYTTENLLLSGYNGTGNYRVTEPDVPVLLSREYGSYADYDPELEIIWSNGLYCLEKDYEEFKTLFAETKPDHYAVISHVPEEDEDGNTNQRFELKLLSETISSELNAALNGKPVDEDTRDVIYNSGNIIFGIYRTTADKRVVEEEAHNIWRNRSGFFIQHGEDLYPLTEEAAKVLTEEVDELLPFTSDGDVVIAGDPYYDDYIEYNFSIDD